MFKMDGDGARRAAAAVVDALLELAAPTRCAGCERPGTLICDGCRAAIEPIDPATSCTGCGAPYGEVLCTECRGEPLASGSCLAAAVFAGPLPRIVRAYKDGGERRLAPVLAGIMVDAAERARGIAPDRYGDMLAVDAVVFVPATARAFRRRGFDHMDAIARAIGADAGVAVVDALVKHGSADQRSLGRRERRSRSSGAYEAVLDVSGAHLLLVDDVITTGSTVRAAASCLSRAGAARVDVLALARVW